MNKRVSYLSDEKALKRFVRLMTKNHDFVGSYIEKRYVTDLGCYKKIIKISRREVIFMDNLSVVKSRLENFYQNSKKWIGITSTDPLRPPIGFNIWADIDEEIFGVYKFRVKGVSFSGNQVSLKLETIGPFEESSNSRDSSWDNSNSANFQTSMSFEEESEKPIMTWENLKQTAVFISLLCLTIVTVGVQVIKYILEYILKLLEVLTPHTIAFFDAISKMFGYICLLIAFLWKGGYPYNGYNPTNQTKQIYYLNNQPAYSYRDRYKALPYNQKSSVRITELKE